MSDYDIARRRVGEFVDKGTRLYSIAELEDLVMAAIREARESLFTDLAARQDLLAEIRRAAGLDHHQGRRVQGRPRWARMEWERDQVKPKQPEGKPARSVEAAEAVLGWNGHEVTRFLDAAINNDTAGLTRTDLSDTPVSQDIPAEAARFNTKGAETGRFKTDGATQWAEAEATRREAMATQEGMGQS